MSCHSVREKSIRHGHPGTLHLWWARRPLAACRAMLLALLLPDPCDLNCGNGQKVKQPGGPSGNGRHELERLIAARFPADRKEQRVAAALRVLETLRLGIPVDLETAKWAAQDAEVEDF